MRVCIWFLLSHFLDTDELDTVLVVFLDLPMQINAAMFERTGRIGYVLKPRLMCDKTNTSFNPLEKPTLPPLQLTLAVKWLSIQLYTVQ